MKRLGRLHFLVGILVSVLLTAQAVIGIMMYVDGSGKENMNRQAVMGQPADRNTVESDDMEESPNSSTATDDSSTETATNDTQGTPQGGVNGSGTPGEMPSGGGFQSRAFAGKFIDFYQGAGGLAASIIIFVIGVAGLATTVISRRIAPE
ncbi:hypothetical protein [Peribacillus simplex]|uniref:hypothetical protein n=1 Tax=Peribacillus simplex TaxID=1478 RepID=UPI000BA63530|nr:hypothetical protein [Peribacillus simplex]PAK42973.1 hypothetical protein CHI08_07860 [Peribacillus simplex]